jgi:SpoVK/Ycf46/Vps4 family AAA+-type ATPase
MKDQIVNYLKAGYPGLYLTTFEEQRAAKEIVGAARELRYHLFTWSCVDGIVSVPEEGTDAVSIPDTEDPNAALAKFKDLAEKSILVMRDLHAFLRGDPYPALVRRIKDCMAIGKATTRHIIITGCELRLPIELEKEITTMEFKLPDRATLRDAVDAICETAKVKMKSNMDLVLDAASGLTTMEAENAFAKSIIEHGDIVPAAVQHEKAETVKKNGLLEIVEAEITMDDIGGLEYLKQALVEMQDLFTAGAREYGIPTPRGMLTVGQPGCGKSLVAKATASIFKLPLIRLDAGKLFGSLVGQSEGNWRNAHATAAAIAPCIMWIDEVDGLFAGAQSSGQTDSGVTARVIKAILQDMQERSEGIFFIFTANDIDGLPDPLIDRLDTWSVDLPNPTEREAIWRIHIAKRGRKPKDYKLRDLAVATEGYSGRQIEQIWLKALTVAFNAHKTEPSAADCIAAVARFAPTSKTMAEAIERRRKRLKDRATPASAPEKAVAVGSRKLHNN